MRKNALYIFQFICGLQLCSWANAYDAHDRRDPFLPMISPTGTLISYDNSVSATDLILEGVILDAKGDNLAVLNGKILRAGDTFGEYAVKSIINDSVELDHNGEIVSVKLKKGAY